jgi:hypothetical protein
MLNFLYSFAHDLSLAHVLQVLKIVESAQKIQDFGFISGSEYEILSLYCMFA